ncbi:hypothetical protein Tco_1168293 [Tanacetum coccineum]
MIIEAEIRGHCMHRMYVDGGSASKILYEHCFSRLRPEIKKQLIPATTPLIGFSGEIIWPIGQIQLLVTIGDEEHSASALMNFVVVRSPFPYNGIIWKKNRQLENCSGSFNSLGNAEDPSRRRACGYDWRSKAHRGAPFKYAEGMLSDEQKKGSTRLTETMHARK